MIFRPRILYHGPPNNGKTKALVNTFPRPMFVLNAPGERGGHGSLPEDDPTCVVYPDIDPNAKSSEILREFKAAYTETIKQGNFAKGTIAVEGMHKLVDYVIDDLMGGAYFQGEKPDWNVFGLYARVIDRMLDTLLLNNTHAVAVTAWSKERGEKKATKNLKAEDIPQTIYPALMGEYARQITGGFQFVFAQTLRLYPDERTDKEGRKLRWAAWQTRPTQAVQGCGIKGPDDIVERIPLYIPADYRYLKQVWENS